MNRFKNMILGVIWEAAFAMAVIGCGLLVTAAMFWFVRAFSAVGGPAAG
jgi:uncharacterized protein YaaW (UPF0174 family)